VNFDGDVLYDEFVKPLERVTDYRTHVSGVRPKDLWGGRAVTFKQAQRDVAALIEGRLLVGHALHNDLEAIMLSHPKNMIRDTAKYKPMLRARANGRKARPKALRQLTKELLGVQIQDGAHSPVIDARAALELYKKHRGAWEAMLKRRAVKAARGRPDRRGASAQRGQGPASAGGQKKTAAARTRTAPDEAQAAEGSLW
jgi:RNA exonuclease 4